MKTKKAIKKVDRNDEQTWFIAIGKPTYDAIKEMIENLENAKTDNERENAETTIQEDPLSVETRSDWHTPGEKGADAEYNILLSTGGPASRIIGELDEHGYPTNARLEVQDWGKPWTEYRPDDEKADEILLKYVNCFYFGG